MNFTPVTERLALVSWSIEIAHQRLDMVIDDRVAIEIKASENLHAGATRQLFNYLRATRLEVGMLLHFGRAAKFRRVICDIDHKPLQSNPFRPSDL